MRTSVLVVGIGGAFASAFLVRRFLLNGSIFRNFQWAPSNDLEGKVVLITGGNTGVGKETAVAIAKMGAKVYVACRNTAKAESVKQEINKATGRNDAINIIQLNLAEIDSVKKCVSTIEELEPNGINILVNNAAVIETTKSKNSKGVPTVFATNHLGPFLLTNLLIPSLEKSATDERYSRIVFVASRGADYADLNKNAWDSVNNTSSLKEYFNSKLANIMTALLLAREFEKNGTKITVNLLHPGWVRSDIDRNGGFFVRTIHQLLAYCFARSPLQGAQTSIRLASDPTLEKVTGKYFEDSTQLVTKHSHAYAVDELMQKELWNYSCSLVGLPEKY